jgi:hypothetical protein
MSDKDTPLLERVASYYTQLSTVAADLNAVSDELGKSIAEIDTSLKKLNLGISTWLTIHGGDGSYRGDSSYWSRDIGYTKVEGKWGISLRKVEGNYQYPDDEKTEEWLFNDAPRSLRLEAIDKIPELLEELSKEAVKTTKNIRAKLDEAKAVAEVLKGAANRSPAISGLGALRRAAQLTSHTENEVKPNSTFARNANSAGGLLSKAATRTSKSKANPSNKRPLAVVSGLEQLYGTDFSDSRNSGLEGLYGTEISDSTGLQDVSTESNHIPKTYAGGEI